MLRFRDQRWWCGLVELEAALVGRGRLPEAVLPSLLGVGTGCGVVQDGGGLSAPTWQAAMARLEPLAGVVGRYWTAPEEAPRGD